MSQFVLPFKRLPPDALAGGKGAALARLTQAGFPVPNGVVVLTGAYRAHIEEGGLREQIQELLKASDFSDLGQLEVQLAQVRDLIQREALPPKIARALRTAYQGLWSERATPPKPVAVRSSGTHEDGAEHSSAGQYKTFLNVLDEGAMLQAVQACWASLWTPQAANYRLNAGQGHEDVAMAVVIQEMVHSTSSGVAFTADPITADSTRVVVAATWGLGEGLVTGGATGDLFVVNKESYEIDEPIIGNKERQVVAGSFEQGTMTVSTKPEMRRQPALSPDHVRQVVTLACDVERAMGVPQDIEWGLHKEKVYLLQARPITTLGGSWADAPSEVFPVDWPDDLDAQYSWRFESSSKRDPLVPLEIGLRHYWYKAREDALYLGGSFISRINQAHIFNGYPYVRNSTLTLTEEEADRLTRRHNANVQAYVDTGTSIWDQEILPEIRETLDALTPVPTADADLSALISYMDRVLPMYQRFWALHWLMAGGGPPDTVWPELFAEITGINDRLLAYDLLQGQVNMTTKLMDGLHSLARTIQRTPRLRNLFEGTDEWDLTKVLQTEPEASIFLGDLEQFLENFGYRTGHSFGSVATLQVPAWREEPAIVYGILKRYLDQDLEAIQRLGNARARARKTQIADVRLQLAASPDALERFDKELHTWQARTVWSEDHNYYIDQMSSALVHIAFKRLGQVLCQTGALESVEDVFFSTIEELRESDDPATHKSLATNVQYRQALYGWWRRLTPPPWLGVPPAVTAGDPAPLPGLHDDSRGINDHDRESVIKGMGAVKGWHSGKARVITDPDIVPRVEPGQILVAINAGEQWTPLFPILGALILDQGSILQHAAIVAREFGVPMVIQTGDATTRIRDGQNITVDGEQGTVELGL